MLNICEIFTSIQGESTLTGYLCAFIRLAECNLRCVWCDTRYSYINTAAIATMMSIDEIVDKIGETPVTMVEITGGEPLLQSDTALLCEELLRCGYKVMIETNGSLDISAVPQEVRRIVDVKCPGSGSCGSFLLSNMEHIGNNDEIKFVVASLSDAAWAKEFCDTYMLTEKCAVTFSPVSNDLPYEKLACWMVENNAVDIRFGIQLHKIIWGDRRGM